MQLLVITATLGTVLSFFVALAFFQNKKVNKRRIGFDTIQYLDEIDAILSAGADWTKDYESKLNMTPCEYKRFESRYYREFQYWSDELYKFHSRLISLYYLIIEGVIKKKLVATCVFPQVKEIYERSQKYTGYLRCKHKDKNINIEIDKLYNLLKTKYPSKK